MENFKGTKGKWHVTPYNNVFMESTRICDLDSITFCTNDEVKANAQLIAHAPEMLEMLKECQRVLSGVQSPATPSILLNREIEDLLTRATTI